MRAQACRGARRRPRERRGARRRARRARAGAARRDRPLRRPHLGAAARGDGRAARGAWRALRPRQRRPAGDRARRAAARSGCRGDAARALDGGAARRIAARAAGGVPGDGRARGRRARRRPLLPRLAAERRGARHGRDAREPGSPRPIAGTTADVVVTAHTHVRYERHALGRTFLNPGSVGMPYEGSPGAYWALLGPGIEHRRTDVRPRRGGAPLPRRAEIRWRAR